MSLDKNEIGYSLATVAATANSSLEDRIMQNQNITLESLLQIISCSQQLPTESEK